MKKIYALITVFLLAISSVAFAQELKIGVVNMTVLTQKSSYMATLNEDFTKKFKSRQDEISKANQKLQNEVNQLALKAATMSNDEQTKLQTQILNDKAVVETLNINLQKDISIAKDQALKSFTTKLLGVLNKIAQDGNYDLIVQNTNSLYVNPKLDITQQVLDQM